MRKDAPAEELASLLMPMFRVVVAKGYSPEEARDEVRHCALAVGYEHATVAADQALARWPTDPWNRRG